MSRSLSIVNKHAVSEMLSYVLVLIIVIGLSVAVYAYLQLQTPKHRLTCGGDVLISIDPAETTCTILNGGAVELTTLLENRGKRGVTGAYIRLGSPTEKVRSLVNEGKVFFGFVPESQSSMLLPGDTFRYSVTLPVFPIQEGSNALEVQPVIGEGKNIALCEQSTVTQRIQCVRATA